MFIVYFFVKTVVFVYSVDVVIKGLQIAQTLCVSVLEVLLELQADRLRSAELFPRRECSVWGRERTTIWPLRVPVELLLH